MYLIGNVIGQINRFVALQGERAGFFAATDHHTLRQSSPQDANMNAPYPDDSGHADEELQLPVLGLYADLELGRGSVLLPDEFLQCSGLLQLQIIEQWQVSLSRYRCNAIDLLKDKLRESMPEASPAERLRALRVTCESAGIVLAPDSSATVAAP